MKHPFRSALVLLALAGATLGLRAEVALKVVTLDMDQVYAKYYKTEAQKTKLEEQAKRARESEDNLKKELETMVTQAKEFQEQTKNAILSEEARKKAQADFESKVGEIRAKDAERQEFMQRAQMGLQKQMGIFQQQAVEEISKVASEIGQKQGATLVLNKGSVPVVIYAAPEFDITEAVIVEINKDAPAPTAKVEAPATTPAAK
jgi:Skp family chaperone for outer membrane proteins